MFRYLIISLLIAGTVHADSIRVINGEKADYWKSNVVFLYSGNTYCSGTLIAPDTILTAAHCKKAALWAISRYKWIKVKKFIKHPLYRSMAEVHEGKFMDYIPVYDLAIVKLEGEFKVTPAKIGFRKRIRRRKSVETHGYGMIEDGTYAKPYNLHNYLRKTTVKVDWVGKHLPYFESPFRATNSGACYGDSGGPAFYRGKLVGVVSYGVAYTCDSWREATGYMGVNSRKVRRFIRKHLR